MHSHSFSTDTSTKPYSVNNINKKSFSSITYKIKVVLRFLAAIVGGYAFTSSFISLLALVLPLSKLDAVLISTTISILVYTCVFIWAFTVKSLTRIWITILLTSGITTLALALVKGLL